MATLTNGQANGHGDIGPHTKRFTDIPSQIEIPVSGAEADEAVEVDLLELFDDPTELCTLLENENAAKNLWMTISLAYAKQHKIDLAIDILNRGLHSLSRGLPKEKIGLLSLQCWLYLFKSREAPRVIPEGQLASEAKTKDYYLQAATTALNEASRVNPTFPPLFLARGILSLLRASLQPPAKAGSQGSIEQSERIDTLRQALKCFEDASRVSAGRNMMALMGKARTLFSLNRFTDALECYQEVLQKMPNLLDPDPRIGIGCCLWQLNHADEARGAWERALELNSTSKAANILVGLCHIKESNTFDLNSPEFALEYKKAITVYTQKAFKLDKEYPITCATFGGYFLPRQAWDMTEKLARKAIEFTDVNAIASDGWYLLARKEHYQGVQSGNTNWNKVVDYYNRADNARGGGDKGFLPAKFGAAQSQIRNRDLDGAKFRLEKIIQHNPNSLEAKVLLGTIYAQEVFENQDTGFKEDRSTQLKKAVMYLETVRMSWKDLKRHSEPDMTLLITLARLYEIDQPEKSLPCLLQVQEMALENLDEDYQYMDVEDEAERLDKAKAQLPPELLNNIGCFQFQVERFADAAANFQLGLNACMNIETREEGSTSDQLVTTISYNLARSYEASGMLDEAKEVYEGLLARHPEYTDAQSRLAYIELRLNPSSEGPRAMAALYEAESQNMEVRALYGWYLHKAKRRVGNIAEDQEQRQYKHTLQQHDKHDVYALTGMGNLYLVLAREMRRDSDQDKEKRHKTYEKAIEFYHKALQLDSKNAFAAQGIGIALAEDKRDFPAAVQIFSKVRDTVKDSSVLINLGHIYGELKQYARAVDNYEAAIAKDRANDPQILASLGRIWLLRGKQEKSIAAMKQSLEFSRKALELAPDQIHFQFNIAFVQIQLAQLIYTLPEKDRLLEDVESAATGLDEAIESFSEIAKAKNPPYPRHDLEQRANMGRNTIRKQLERAVQAQREYEEANAEKLAKARAARDEELRKREEVRRAAAAVEAERQARLREQRQKMLDEARVLGDKKAEEERQRDDAEWTENTDGERVKRKSRKRTKRREKTDVGSDASDAEAAGENGDAPRKKRKLTSRKGAKVSSSKYKSADRIVDSDEEAGDDEAPPSDDGLDEAEVRIEANGADASMADAEQPGSDADRDEADDAPEPAAAVVRKQRKKVARIIEEDDDENENDEPGYGEDAPAATAADMDDSD